MLNILKFVTRNKEILPKRAVSPEMDPGKKKGGGEGICVSRWIVLLL